MEGEQSKESTPSSSRPLFPLFPAVEKVSSDETAAGKWLCWEEKRGSKKCIGRESNPGLPRGRREFYH